MSIIQKRLQIAELCSTGMLYRKLIENLPQRIYVKDSSLTYVFCNEAFAQDLNIMPDAILGKSDYDFFPRELAERMITEENEILNSGVKRQVEEQYVFSEKELTVLATKVPVRSDNGDIIGLQVAWQDVTNDKRRAESILYLIKNLEEQLSQSDSKIHTLESYIEKITAHRNEIEARIRDLQESTKQQMFTRDADIEKLKNDLQRESTERKEVVELLQKSFAQIQDLMNSAQYLTVLSSTRNAHYGNEDGLSTVSK